MATCLATQVSLFVDYMPVNRLAAEYLTSLWLETDDLGTCSPPLGITRLSRIESRCTLPEASLQRSPRFRNRGIRSGGSGPRVALADWKVLNVWGSIRAFDAKIRHWLLSPIPKSRNPKKKKKRKERRGQGRVKFYCRFATRQRHTLGVVAGHVHHK